MKQFREFKSQQQVVNEIGPVGATIATVMGIVGGAMALKKGLDKFKGYRESQREKKANRESGIEIEIKKINPQTGEEYEELVPLSGRDANLDAAGVEKKRKEMQGKYNNLQKGKDKAKANENIRKALGKGPKDPITKDDQKKGMALIKKELEPDSPEDEEEPTGDSETDTSTKPEDDPEQELKSKGDKQPEDGGITDDGEANNYYKLVGKAPTGWEMDWVNPKTKKSKKLFKKSDLEKRRAQTTQGKVTGKDTSAADKLLRRNSRLLKFGEFIKEDVMKDMRKISKSKKDMEIKLDDGTEIPIDPMTAEIFVKYIEGLKSSEQKKVINQIQRTERGFMKVLGKAHGE